jgi:hypothetical protein
MAVPYNLTDFTHSFYEPLRPLIKDLAGILVLDRHWLPASNPRSDPYYVTEAFQRLILEFMIKHRGEDFMICKVGETFREVEGVPHSNGKSITDSQKFDASIRFNPPVEPLVCGSVNFCLFLLLCFTGVLTGHG